MRIMNLKSILSISALILLWTGCTDSSTGPDSSDLTGESVSYELTSLEGSSVEGTITFEERVDGYTLATVELSNLDEESEYPVNVYENTALAGGDLLLSLKSVDEADGESETIIQADEDGNTLTYEDLLEMNAHINVHPDDDDLDTILAQSDMGDNELTGESFSLDLEEIDNSGVYGTAEFFERNSGEILAVIELDGTDASRDHPAHLYEKVEDEDDLLLLELNPVDGETGISRTNIDELNEETSFSYEDLTELDGLTKVYLSEDDMSVIANGDFNQESE